MLENIHRALGPGGRIAVVEFKSRAIFGPPMAERISEEELRSLLGKAGFGELRVSSLTSSLYVAMGVKAKEGPRPAK